MKEQQHLACSIGFALLALAACDRATSPSPPDAGKGSAPHLTVAEGFVTASLTSASVGQIHWNSNLNGFDAQLSTSQNTDIYVGDALADPNGATTGWHAHPGPAFVLVKSGAVTAYSGDDPTCTGKTYTAGMSFIEGTTPHILRNEGVLHAEIVVVFFVPAGQERRIDVPAPGNCPF
jgi:hypothetical protein